VRILTHTSPDLDAIVSAWLAQRFLLNEPIEVDFASRGLDPKRYPGDCLVDIGNTYDPSCLRFDHKPPAFADRNSTCAARLVWEHLLTLGRPVRHLQALVRVTFEGDTRRHSPELQQSWIDGPHARLKRLHRLHDSDAERYAQMRRWLDQYDQQARQRLTSADQRSVEVRTWPREP
jgi:hypothetical protein